MLRYRFTFIAFALGIGIVILSTIPLAFPQKEAQVIEIDKLAHVFAYFCFATSLFLALDLDWKFKTSKNWTIISAFALGLVLEIIQGSFLPYRSFELYDILANTLGIVLFIFLSKRVKKLLSNAVFL